jgi:hypothetical protein
MGGISSDPHYAELHRFEDGLGAVLYPKFRVDVSQVVFDGLIADK